MVAIGDRVRVDQTYTTLVGVVLELVGDRIAVVDESGEEHVVHKSHVSFWPDQEEIARRRDAIKKTWSAHECSRRARAIPSPFTRRGVRYDEQPYYTIPEVRR